MRMVVVAAAVIAPDAGSSPRERRPRLPLNRGLSLLLVFRSLARAPSTECGLCLLAKLGLAQYTARLFRGSEDRCRAFNIFDALPPHTFSASYTRPIRTTPHNALTLNMYYTAKPPGECGETGGFASAPQTMPLRRAGIVGAVEPANQESPVRPRNYTPTLRGLVTNWERTLVRRPDHTSESSLRLPEGGLHERELPIFAPREPPHASASAAARAGSVQIKTDPATVPGVVTG